MDFRKAFDTVPRASPILKLEEIGAPMELIWGIMALYGIVMGQFCTLKGVFKRLHATIGVKQGCPLSPTLFGLYVDEISHYIKKGDEKGA